MDNMSNTLQTVMQVQEQYRKVMEPWIKHQEMINQIVNPLGDITGQIQNSLNFRNEWIDTLGLATEIVKPMHSLFEQHAGMIKSLQSVAKTPELLGLQNQLVSNNLFATADYIKDITAVWRVSLKIDDIWQRSIAAQNIAFLRLTPDYRALSLPRGGKKAIRGLTKTAAQRVIQTDDILFDPKDAEYFHKNSPDKKVNANEISVVESSIELFEKISFSDLIAFESQLFDDITFAKEHPVGARIYEIIDGWKEFIDFDMPTYFHARALNDSGQAYLDQEMLKAPQNISGHGRYNAIGKSCYYFAESCDGAVSEIRKHAGNKKTAIQVVEIRPIKKIRLIDLSKKISSQNKFMEHLRYTVENSGGKIVKQYLLPNYVASCCKRLGIDGIKYLSGNYACYVTWKDDYFDFVGREIIEPE